MALAGLTWEICLAYLDDLIIFSRTFDQHIERLQRVFDRLVQAGLKLKPSKCALFQRRVKFLRSIVSGEGIEPDPEKVQVVANPSECDRGESIFRFGKLLSTTHQVVR